MSKTKDKSMCWVDIDQLPTEDGMYIVYTHNRYISSFACPLDCVLFFISSGLITHYMKIKHPVICNDWLPYMGYPVEYGTYIMFAFYILGGSDYIHFLVHPKEDSTKEISFYNDLSIVYVTHYIKIEPPD